MASSATQYYAFHVTDLKECDEKYKYLKPSPANDPHYDGALQGLPVVFLTTTVFPYENFFSCYPDKGVEGVKYQMVRVPMNRFENYDWWKVTQVPGKNNVMQVHVLLTQRPWTDLLSAMCEAKIKGFERLSKKKLTIQSPDPAGGIFKLDALEYIDVDKTWKVNTYSTSSGKKCCVNIAILHELKLDSDCKWDTATRTRHTTRKKQNERRQAKESTPIALFQAWYQFVVGESEETARMKEAYDGVIKWYESDLHKMECTKETPLKEGTSNQSSGQQPQKPHVAKKLSLD